MAEIRRVDVPQSPESSSDTGIAAVPPPERTLPGMPEGANLPLPVSETPLTRAAQTAGRALGNTVNRARTRLTLVRRPETDGASATEKLSEKLKDYSETASAQLQDLKQEAQQRGERLAQTLQQRTAELGSDVRARVRTLRQQSQRIQRDYPLQVILGCAAAAFVLGFTLRIWRSVHD